MSKANERLRYSIYHWLKKVFEWLLVGAFLHILVAIWTMFWGLWVYGFSDQVLMLGALVAITSFIASAPGAYAMWFECSKRMDEITYLTVGFFSGAILTLLGGVYYLFGRLAFSVQTPEAWTLAAWVSIVSVVLAVLSLPIYAYLDMRAD